MTDSPSLDQAQAALADPTTSADTLYEIAAAHPGLWARVAAHPNAYTDLLTWLNDVGDAPVRAAVAARRGITRPVIPPAATFVPSLSPRTPSTSAFRGASSHPATTTPLSGSSFQHITPPPRDLTLPWRDLTPGASTPPLRDFTLPVRDTPPLQAASPPLQAFTPPLQAAAPALIPPVVPVPDPAPPEEAPTPAAQAAPPVAVAPVVAAPAQATAATPTGPAASRPDASDKSDSTTPGWMRPVIIALSIAVLLVVALLVYLLVIKPTQNTGTPTTPSTTATSIHTAPSTAPPTSTGPDLAAAQAAFTSAATEFNTAQAALAAAITAATAPAATPAEQLITPALLTALATALTNAQAAVAPAPAMAATAPEIIRQTSQLQADTVATQTATTTLTAATAAVQADRVAAAQKAIGDAVALAQPVYDDSKGLADEAARAALLAGITNAKAASTALKTADPATVNATATEWWNKLDQLSKAVLATKKTKCSDQVTLPVGVDPRVCSGIPAGSIAFPSSGDGTAMFQMPSGNIGCTAGAYGLTLMCEIKSVSWTMPDELKATCQGTYGSGCGGHEVGLSQGFVIQVGHGDVPPWTAATLTGVSVPTLEYGQIAVSGTGACISGQDGVTCWDMMSSHGFKMSAQTLLVW